MPKIRFTTSHKRIHHGAYTKGYGCGRGHHHFVSRGKYMRCTQCGATKTK